MTNNTPRLTRYRHWEVLVLFAFAFLAADSYLRGDLAETRELVQTAGQVTALFIVIEWIAAVGPALWEQLQKHRGQVTQEVSE